MWSALLVALSLYDYMAVGHEGAGGGVLTCSIAARLIVLQHGWMIQLVQTRFPCYGGNEARDSYTLIYTSIYIIYKTSTARFASPLKPWCIEPEV